MKNVAQGKFQIIICDFPNGELQETHYYVAIIKTSGFK